MTLKEAIRILIEEEHMEDWIYHVKSAAAEDGSRWKGSLWDHPRVQRYSEVCKVLKDHLK